jgi:hypothetical protein
MYWRNEMMIDFMKDTHIREFNRHLRKGYYI